MRRTLVAAALVVSLLGVPSTARAVTTARLAGADRFATAAAVARASFSPVVPVVFVVTGLAFPDALTAGAAAAHRGGPVLLVQRSAVPSAAAEELDRLDPASIVVVGGEGAVSADVAAQLERHTTGDVARVSGADRYSTAVAVSRATFASASTVYVAGGERVADALAAAPTAHTERAPLLLVERSTVREETLAEIRRLGAARAVILGGTASVDDAAASQLRAAVGDVVRVAGDDRYATSVRVSQRAFPDGASTAYLASGSSWADALAAGPAAALAPGPVLLARGNCVPPAVESELARLEPSRVVLLGGSGVLEAGVERRTVCPYGGAPLRTPSVPTGAATVWATGAPDPHLVRFGSDWYLYSTGTTWGNHIGVLVSDRPDGGWRTTTGRSYGSSALPDPPSWQTVDTQWAPGVYEWRGRYALFYAAQVRAHGHWCVTVATADDPAGPFRDTSSGPIICQTDIGGSIDPHPFVDADGRPWLHWKSNDGSTPDVSKVWAAPLDRATGTAVAGAVREVMAKDTERYPWQTTLDNPQLVLAGGLHYLFYTAGDWQDDTYRVGYAVCATPVGPCTSGDQPILASYGDVAGPGGGTVEQDAEGRWWMSYHAWDSSCTNDACGGTRRLYVAPLTFR